MESPKHGGDSVGIDMGCVRFCTLSDGTFFEGSVSIFVSRVVFKGAANHGCPSCIGG